MFSGSPEWWVLRNGWFLSTPIFVRNELVIPVCCFINDTIQAVIFFMKRHAENLISDHVMCVYKVTRIDQYALRQPYLRYDWPTSLENLWYMFYPSGFAVAVVKIGRYSMGPMTSRLNTLLTNSTIFLICYYYRAHVRSKNSHLASSSVIWVAFYRKSVPHHLRKMAWKQCYRLMSSHGCNLHSRMPRWITSLSAELHS